MHVLTCDGNACERATKHLKAFAKRIGDRATDIAFEYNRPLSERFARVFGESLITTRRGWVLVIAIDVLAVMSRAKTSRVAG